ncbi:CpsD/CapB family tyrosine-protein kinase [Ramlibacter sp.]|uniref:CpsD/CapB family tyrosine-protein kinase n=1 Tax=Ramlibacter sp. TaxID=1917967 RepID=UPI002D32C139|nr:CpsD/CapB family tyrosine-protein kinase [Ramlibacter sp.]HYD75994.1 CpsD/CapB family tyrosine-protein kinase [Ramlibacter sp.]
MSAAASGALGPIGDPEAFGLLRDKLLAGPWGSAARRALAIVSVHPGDGRSYVCASLAISLGLLGRRTLLIDADTARPSLHRLFGADNHRGLSDVLAGVERASCIQPLSAVPMVSLLPSGPLASMPPQETALAELVKGATGDFDHVILDTPPADVRPEALAIAEAAGFALVLACGGSSPLASVRNLVDALVNAGVQVTGVVVNDH